MTKRQEQVVIAAQGNQVGVMHQRTDSDSPMLPVNDIVSLMEICPDAVQIILEETKKEAEFRRNIVQKEQTRYYVHRIVGQILAFLMGMAGIIGGVICVKMNHPGAGTTIASMAILSLAFAFLGLRPSQNNEKQKTDK